jgi:hypothetical protein
LCFGKNWYYLNNATDKERDSAVSTGCFHGNYGPISLLSCNLPNAQFLATLPSTTYLCAVQTSNLEDFAITEAPLLQIDDWYLLTSESDYSCLDENVGRSLRVTVSPTPWKAPREYSFINATAVDPYIQSILDAVDSATIYQEIITLSNFHTRQAQSSGARQAQNYLSTTFRDYGFTVTAHTWQSGYSDNVIAEIRGTTSPNEIVVIGAHYDSRSTDRFSTTARAPGADDNGSGTATNIELARVISQLGVRFRRTLRILAFSGEEQGLLGSRAYAALISNRGDNVVAMFNGDMLGYFPNRPGVPRTLGMPTRFISNPLLTSANSITREYLPNLRIGTTNACCSDQQSFTENGYPAIGYFESELAATAYPGYHNANDLPNLLDQEQLGLLGKAIIASTLTYAQAFAGEEEVISF